ncbi:uncharacterized protein EHS24_008774 [Apiotrichum porosum]|uniref:NmrA-like domain-containing protein n=1 Tax=Apiotrichum porosum TaxID=105984 RepID=A0A427XRB1_9TREE|nr:uncharacterized protein EHS24_008774 [Apiotrichum porosum]RSH81331.1 hypothetical protein EHS24_008774 [Apiotrichum porosum]
MELNTILVIGATGQQGSAVCKYLSSQTKTNKILAVSRDLSSAAATSLKAIPRIQMVTGDLNNPTSLFSSVAEHGDTIDGLFFMCHSSVKGELELSNAILSAAAVHGVKYVVYSGVDLSGTEKTGIDAFDVKRDVWAHLQTLPLKSTFLGPAGFLETLFWPGFPAQTQSWPKDYVHKYIATDDIGRVAALCFANPEKYASKKLMLAGDAEIGRLPAPEEDVNPFVVHMFGQLQVHPFEANPTECRREFGGMIDLKTWLTEVYRPASIGRAYGGPNSE